MMSINKWGYFLIALIAIPIGLYFSIFDGELSHDSEDWGNFGDFIGSTSSLALSIVVFFYTYNIDKRESKRLLLKQIESILTKIEIYNDIVSTTNNANNFERGQKDFDKTNEITILSHEIRSSYLIAHSLATNLGIDKSNNSNMPEFDHIKTIATEWLNKLSK